MWWIIGFIVLFWIGVKLNRWVNGSSKIAKNQEKLLEELRKQILKLQSCPFQLYQRIMIGIKGSLQMF